MLTHLELLHKMRNRKYTFVILLHKQRKRSTEIGISFANQIYNSERIVSHVMQSSREK